jgi:hypothetical protein
VAVRAWRLERILADPRNGAGLVLVQHLPEGSVDLALPQTGPYVEINVEAWDAQVAAEFAFSRVGGILGAVAIFQPKNVEVRSRVVGVRTDQGIVGHDVTRRLPVQTRVTTTAEITKIAVSSTRYAAEVDSDALFEAIRHRTRAIETEDPESRFILLWFGIERLVLGAPGYGKTLQAVREIIPRAITLGKLRTEVAELAAGMLVSDYGLGAGY